MVFTAICRKLFLYTLNCHQLSSVVLYVFDHTCYTVHSAFLGTCSTPSSSFSVLPVIPRYFFFSSIKMDKISDVKFGPLENSIYLRPLRMHYKQNNVTKNWDIMDMHSSVAVIIYNITRNVLVFVKQFRPGVYHVNIPEEERDKPVNMKKYPAELGMTLELCAGILDKDKSLVEIAQEEVLEECGYEVPLEKFERLHGYCANIGTSGNVLTMYYCEVTDEMKVSTGGGIDDELIEVVEMTVEEFKKYTEKSVIRSPGSLLIAFYWFILNKYKS